MYAVVVLFQAREHCVVPQEYIFGLDEIEAEMKTWGVHKQHKHLIFWSRALLNDTYPVGIVDPPNFDLDPIDEFPPPDRIDSACYLGRIKRFFSE